MPIPCNVGGGDKTFRIVLGLGLLAVAFLIETNMTWRVLTLVAASIALGTAFTGFCPINKLLGLNTCRSSST